MGNSQADFADYNSPKCQVKIAAGGGGELQHR